MNLLLDLPQKPVWVSAYLPINVPEFRTQPDRSTDCTNISCKDVLERFGNRQTRLIHNEAHYVVPYVEWLELCPNCRRSFHNWYYKELLHSRRRDRMPFEIFELEIEKEAILDLWEYLGKMLHYSSNDADRDEIMEMLDESWSLLKDVEARFTEKSEDMDYVMKCFDCVKNEHDETCNTVLN